MNPFVKSAYILKTLREHGHEAYFVGGSVRDYIMHRPCGDIDITTSALPEEVQHVFPRTVPTGIQHGTVLVLVDGEGYEVTTYRTESEYKDFRRPDHVTFVRNLKDDLMRRDFTMNALAMDEQYTIVDYWNGQEDIKNRCIRTVGNPQQRFQEDGLRMLRAIRFMSTLQFTIEDATLQAIENHRALLQHISIERKTIEWEKCLLGAGMPEAIEKLVKTGVYECLPGLESRADVLLQFAQYGKQLHGSDVETFWATLLYIMKIETTNAFLRGFKLSNERIKSISRTIELLKIMENERLTPWMVYVHKEEIALRVATIRLALYGTDERKIIGELWKSLPIHERQQLDVNGKDLLLWRGTERGGPWLKEWLDDIEREVVTGALSNDKDAIKEWLNQCQRI